jgi:sulfite exporter TauE/SafE
MCGPFALLAATGTQQRKAALIPTAAYSLGRLVTYSIVGLIFGALGLMINNGAGFSPWQQAATYIAGALMIVVGSVSLVRYLGLSVKLPQLFQPLLSLLQQVYSHTISLNPLARALSIGALTSLMPCGWLYTFAITAAGTGHPLWGMLLMITFWAGTVPTMTALMLGVDRIGSRIQKQLPPIMASLVISLGLFTIAFRAPVEIGNEGLAISGTDKLTEQVNEIDHERLPCCHR